MICMFVSPDSVAMILQVNSEGITTHGLANAKNEWWMPLHELLTRSSGWMEDPTHKPIKNVIDNLPGYRYFKNLTLPLCEHHPELLI